MPVDLVSDNGQDIVIQKMHQRIVSYILLIETLLSVQMETLILMLLLLHQR